MTDSSIRPIETVWQGFRFRSRTEARWAVMFTAAGEPFEYEPEGFALPSGWYLPDFWLPERKVWLEVKGQDPTAREIAVACELAAATKHDVLFAVGAPSPDNFRFRLADSAGFDLETIIYWPDDACLAARGERFDGRKPDPRPTVRENRARERNERWWW